MMPTVHLLTNYVTKGNIWGRTLSVTLIKKEVQASAKLDEMLHTGGKNERHRQDKRATHQ